MATLGRAGPASHSVELVQMVGVVSEPALRPECRRTDPTTRQLWGSIGVW